MGEMEIEHGEVVYDEDMQEKGVVNFNKGERGVLAIDYPENDSKRTSWFYIYEVPNRFEEGSLRKATEEDFKD